MLFFGVGHCATLSATEHRVPGKWKLTSDPVNLATWNHFYLLSCIHFSQNQWITSRFFPALLVVNACMEMAGDLVIFVTAAATTAYWRHGGWEYLQFLLKVSKYFSHRWPLWWPYLLHATEDIQVWMYFLWGPNLRRWQSDKQGDQHMGKKQGNRHGEHPDHTPEENKNGGQCSTQLTDFSSICFKVLSSETRTSSITYGVTCQLPTEHTVTIACFLLFLWDPDAQRRPETSWQFVLIHFTVTQPWQMILSRQ